MTNQVLRRQQEKNCSIYPYLNILNFIAVSHPLKTKINLISKKYN